MKAIVQGAVGDASTLSIGDVERPTPGSGELLVRVAATALNRADIHQREGRYPPPVGASPLLGLEVAGIVEATGPEVDLHHPGDRVCALLSGGGYAEYAVVPAVHALPVPPQVSLVQAAGIAEAFLTAHQALFLLGGLQPDQTVLIHAGASGVGTSAIQLAREAGARVLATCSAAKRTACLDLGAEMAIDYREQRFADVVAEATGGAGVHVVVDPVGAPYLADNVASLAVDGRLVVLATMGGSVADRFDLRPLFRKRGTLVCSTLRNRSHAYKANLVAEFVERWMGALGTLRIAPVIDSIVPWEHVAEAHRRMEAGLNVGKIVLRVDSTLA